MKFILGRKLNMSQIFKDDGRVVPVTVVQAGPCHITQVKTIDKDGYQAVQVGYLEKKKIFKSVLGHLKGLPKYRYLKEFKIDTEQELARGKELKVNIFEIGEKVKAVGISKGKGFQGVVKRHGFHGSPASHGHKDQLRMPGSIGSTDAARVFKGKRMAGRMGTDRVTVSNLEIIDIDLEMNLIYLKGAVPGTRDSLIMIRTEGEIKEIVISEPQPEIVEPVEVQPEEVKSEEAKSKDEAKEEKEVKEVIEEPKVEEKKDEVIEPKVEETPKEKNK